MTIFDNKIRYAVYFDVNKIPYSYLLHDTVITEIFDAYIENVSPTNIYFRLHGSNDLVIIPHNWITFMAPKLEDDYD